MKVTSPGTAELVNVSGKPVLIPAEGLVKGIYFIRIPEKEVKNARTVVTLGIYESEKLIETVKVKFIGPVSKASDAKRN